MSEYIVKVLDADYITHDVRRFMVEKPEGYSFLPGQATDVALNIPEWRDELRPFTFTGLKEQPYLEFMIKTYKDHKGVTNLLSQVDKGDELIIHDVFGAIQYHGKGTFIAGGAGITPFIAIFRDLHKKMSFEEIGCFSLTKHYPMLFLEDELMTMLKTDFIKIFTRENNLRLITGRIDKKFLADHITDIQQQFYVCGPDPFVQDISKILLHIGAPSQAVVFEE